MNGVKQINLSWCDQVTSKLICYKNDIYPPTSTAKVLPSIISSHL